ncbi:MAG: efflux RND transporter periplasmic adaptor subunit [Candidatus Marinimicrobia bacterium]|nr:efflux RND transporter periplasmic adaptor subunit [Candidatus Neomarinimicrobiota bacterium]
MRKYLTIIMIAILVFGCSKKEEKQATEIEKIPVEVLIANSSITETYLVYSGILQPLSTVQIFPEVAGKITDIFVNEGEMVKIGSALAQIEKTDYLIGLTQAKAGLRLAEAGFNNSKSNLERQTKLQNEGFSSDAMIEGMQTAYEVSKAQLDQAKAGYKRAKRQVDRTTIKAPISGYVSSKFVEKGQMAVNSAPAFIVQNINKLKINLSVSAKKIKNISLNSEVKIESNNASNEIATGKVVFVGKTNSPSGGYPVRIEINNSNRKLLAGESIKVKISESKKKAITIPGKSIDKKEGHWTAYVIQDRKAKLQQIQIYGNIDNKVIIKNGLNVGDTIIVRGQNYCESGSFVKINRIWNNIENLIKKKEK